MLLVDREIGVTLKRVSGNLSWWKRFGLFSGLLATMLSREEVEEEEIERLKEGDVLETTFAEFAEDRQDLYLPLIDERDRYMAARLREEIAGKGHENVLAVLGAGHLKGVSGYLEERPAGPEGRDRRARPPAVAQALAQAHPLGHRCPDPVRLRLRLFQEPGARLAGGAGLGAHQRQPLRPGCAIAAAHPLTVIAAFVAAPLTSLNPTVGAGMVTGAVELYLRKPSVGDFGRLRQDTSKLKGWWRNRVSRTLLVFLFSTLGSAIGTYVAGFRIFDRLIS